MMRRHTKVLRRPDEEVEYRPRHALDLRNTRNDPDRLDATEAPADQDDADAD